ncbi:c-type cytochrome [Methylovirgula sp. 4M-Z18]|uniref:c-type cytochrome n=1 Tax=Methylovirgula sp. 4M-Z18 TaxID=2293567 RepID=UPI000E2F7A3B|nr:cytochrome c family protein [Methylovirgula sp. 4M-Z18]RFB79184.1 cytochrome c family protein [Methylovirgula sp. 4M-Z18]
MDSFEFNKIAGAVLGTLLFTFALGLFSEAIFSQEKPAKPGYDLPAVADNAAGGVAPKDAAPAVPLPELLAKADPKKGEQFTKACQACHSFDKGGPAKVGPPLYGVVGRAKGSVAGFAYSDAMKGKGGDWSYDDINAFITNPRGFVSGTKMGFAGEKDAGHRADILAYLRTLSDSPVDFPK